MNSALGYPEAASQALRAAGRGARSSPSVVPRDPRDCVRIPMLPARAVPPPPTGPPPTLPPRFGFVAS